MWGSFKSYLGQYYVNAEENVPQLKATNEIENDWVLVDMEGNEIKTRNDENAYQQGPTITNMETCLTPLPLLDISNTSSPHSSPQLSPTKIEEGWFVAPPPCFTKNSPGKIEISPLEDLLIEHPSMSVYTKLREFQPRVMNEASNQAVMKPNEEDKAAKRTKEMTTSQSSVSDEKQKITAVKSQLDLKSFLDQAENMKPAQQAKWQNDQFKLCPSYLNRQNRVHRYQSRKHHNQKKKSLAKPFAEKGKHNF